MHACARARVCVCLACMHACIQHACMCCVLHACTRVCIVCIYTNVGAACMHVLCVACMHARVYCVYIHKCGGHAVCTCTGHALPAEVRTGYPVRTSYRYDSGPGFFTVALLLWEPGTHQQTCTFVRTSSRGLAAARNTSSRTPQVGTVERLWVVLQTHRHTDTPGPDLT